MLHQSLIFTDEKAQNYVDAVCPFVIYIYIYIYIYNNTGNAL